MRASGTDRKTDHRRLEPNRRGLSMNFPRWVPVKAMRCVWGVIFRDKYRSTTALRSGDICYSACPYCWRPAPPAMWPERCLCRVPINTFSRSTLLPALLVPSKTSRRTGKSMTYLDFRWESTRWSCSTRNWLPPPMDLSAAARKS